MAYEGKGIWAVAEVRHGKVSSTLAELLTAGRKLADERGETLTAVLIGGGVKAAADDAASKGADKVIVIDAAKRLEADGLCVVDRGVNLTEQGVEYAEAIER